MVEKSFDNILYQEEGNVATITFNRPRALNSVSTSLMKEMRHALAVSYTHLTLPTN